MTKPNKKTTDSLTTGQFDQFSKKFDNFIKEFIRFQDVTNLQHEQVQNQIDQKFNQVLNGLDKNAGELKTIREEQIFHQASHDRIGDIISQIQQTPTVAHELKSKKKLS